MIVTNTYSRRAGIARVVVLDGGVSTLSISKKVMVVLECRDEISAIFDM